MLSGQPNINVVYITLKYVGMVVSGVSGLFGITINFRDRDGKITKAGKAAIALICFGSTLAMVCEALDQVRVDRADQSLMERRADDTLNAVKQTEKVIDEINRGLQPIMNVAVGYRVRIPSGTAGMQAYTQRVKTTLARAQRDGNLASIPGVDGGGDDKDGPTNLMFNDTSPLVPTADSAESEAKRALKAADIRVSIFRTPIPPEEFAGSAGFGDTLRGDLVMEIFSSLSPRGLAPSRPLGRHSIDYNIRSGEFSILAYNVSSDSKSWHTTGEVVGINDLLGAQLFVVVLPNEDTGGDANAIFSKEELDELSLTLTSGRTFILHSKQLTKFSNPHGLPIYFFNFPSTQGGLLILQSQY